MSPSATRSIEVYATPEQILPLVVETLHWMKANINQVVPKNGWVYASKGFSFGSWGENIRVWMTPSEKGTIVHILSECSMPAQLVDWGKNTDNVLAFERGFIYFLENPPRRADEPDPVR